MRKRRPMIRSSLSALPGKLSGLTGRIQRSEFCGEAQGRGVPWAVFVFFWNCLWKVALGREGQQLQKGSIEK